MCQTAPASSPDACRVEQQLLLNGNIPAIAFSSTAEVGASCPCPVVSHEGTSVFAGAFFWDNWNMSLE